VASFPSVLLQNTAAMPRGCFRREKEKVSEEKKLKGQHHIGRRCWGAYTPGNYPPAVERDSPKKKGSTITQLVQGDQLVYIRRRTLGKKSLGLRQKAGWGEGAIQGRNSVRTKIKALAKSQILGEHPNKEENALVRSGGTKGENIPGRF